MSDFDIKQHEWNKQGDVVVHVYDQDEISFDTKNAFIAIAKKDAIAIAKHFGLTKEDFE